MADIVHKSAHPSLPPAAPQQVVQYLLAKNFHLTALELLVEAQQAGHGDDVRDLEAFFSDPDRFPPEELARYQPDNALDLQATGRERESRLQLAEYELRLAKEDLAEMARKLAQAQGNQQPQATHTGNGATAGAAAPASASSPFSPEAAPQLPLTGFGAGPGARLSFSPQVSGALPTPEEKRVLNMAVFAHLLRQGLVTTAMTMEEEYGGALRPIGQSSVSSVGTATHGSTDVEHPWDLWLWYQAATMPLPPLANATDASCGGATAQGTVAPAGQVGSAALLPMQGGGPAVAAVVDPDDLIRQYDLGPEPRLDSDRGPATVSRYGDEMGLTGDSSTAAVVAITASIDSDIGVESPPGEEQDARQLRGLLTALREELAETRARARAAVVAAVGAVGAATAGQRQQHDQQKQQQELKPALQSKQQSTALKSFSYIASDSAVLDLLDLGSSSGFQTAAGVDAASAAAADAGLSAAAVGELVDSAAPQVGPESSSRRNAVAGPSSKAGAPGTAAGPLEQRQAASEAAAERPSAATPAAAAAAGVETHVTDDASELPLWLRRRQENEIDSTYHSSLQNLLQGLCDMLPRLVPNLNLKSRVEVLPLLVTAAKTNLDWTVRRQLLSAVFNLVPAPDHQQRQAIIDSSLELCRAFGSGWAATELVQLCCRQASSASSERRTLVAEALGEAVGAVDPGTQAHVLLTQLSQLARDRMEQVREAACHSLARLVPRLPFTRSYFTTLEGLLLPLATDSSEAVHVAALSYLVPALLTWQPQDTEAVLVSSCLARVLSEMGQQARIIEQYQQHFLHQQMNHPSQQQQEQPTKAGAAATAPAGPSAADTGDAGGGGTAATASNSGISFAGTFLRYTHAPPPSPPPPAPAPGQEQVQTPQLSSDGQAGGGGIGAVTGAKGSTSNLSEVSSVSQSAAQAAQLSPPSVVMPSTPPPPPQWVTFGRCNFPSASHLLLYQLLALYSGLTPALRHAALRTRPAWACPAGIGSGSGTGSVQKSGPGATVSAGSSAGPQGPIAQSSAAGAGIGRRPHKAGSFGSSDAASANGGASIAAAVATNTALRDLSQLLPATHRRTSSQPVFLGFGPVATGGSDGGDGAQSSIPAGRLLHQNVNLEVQMNLAKSSSSSTLATGGTGSSTAPAAMSGGGDEAVAAAVVEGGGGNLEVPAEQAQSHWSRREEALGSSSEAVDDGERAEEDASFALWATHESHSSWKTLEWLMQHVVPELIRLVCCVGPIFPEAQEVRRQVACAVAATCNALGVPFTQAAVEPVFLVASGTGAHTAPGIASGHPPGGGGGGGGGSAAASVLVADFDAPLAVQDVCAAVQPRTPEALYMARQCVLPVLLVSVLPSARQLRPYLLQLMGSAHELRQRWLLDALPDYTSAITFACLQRPDLIPQVLHVLEDLLSGARSNHAAAISQQKDAGGSDTAAVVPAAAATAASSGGPASTHVGLCCAALARALVPVASLELASRRILPGLMALMSYGEPELQRACVSVLAELAQRFRDQGPRVSEQVLAVYDSLLEQGSHAVKLDVLAAGTSMAAAAAPSAAVAAAAAAQVEWLLTVVQAVAARLTSSAASTAGSGGAVGAPSLDQQRALAAQLLAALRAVAPYDLRLPRLQANLNAALDAIQRCKALLPDPQQQSALTALLKERPTGPSAAGSSISSTTPSVAASVPAGAAAANAALHRMGATQPLPPTMFPYSSPPVPASGLGVTVTPTQATASSGGLMNSFLPPNGGSAAQPNQGLSDSGAGGQLRSRFDAFRQRLMKRRDDAPATTLQGPTGGGASIGGPKPKESFFSDDEGE
ncbi:hypothetical protein Vafri_11775 [Volvox africanus]|uniref:LisH domain-containing protein n=1 Tax=Volvox africanus TaxID=51714 RepID=A0A8J4B9L6_9CHLO|nr:hypothetical protein Vafri_11775 [Volvox africanus]